MSTRFGLRIFCGNRNEKFSNQIQEKLATSSSETSSRFITSLHMNYIHLFSPPHRPIQATIICYSFMEDEEEKEVQQQKVANKKALSLSFRFPFLHYY